MAYQFEIDTEKCKGCGICISVCPKKVLKLQDRSNDKGYYPAVRTQPENCNYCGICFQMCPDVAITIIEIVDKSAAA